MRRSLWIIVVVAMALGLWACGGSDDGNGAPKAHCTGNGTFLWACGGSDDGNGSGDGETASGDATTEVTGDASGETTTPPADPVEALTHATPLMGHALLAEAHSGWGQADCLSCHEVTHGGAEAPDCAFCHGANGAPRRPLDHKAAGCTACHADSHDSNAAGWEDARACASCHKYVATDDCPQTVETDVVVIGAGGGGLGAAVTLANAGLDVVVIERHNKVGGYMTNFNRGDYRFEISLHAMGGFDGEAPGTATMFERFGILDRVQPVKAENTYKNVYPDYAFTIPDGFEPFKEALIAEFPHEAEGIEYLFWLFAKVDEALGFFAELGMEATLAKYQEEEPELMPTFLKMLNATLSEVLLEQIEDPKLFAVLTQLASYIGEPPDELSALNYIVMWNGYHMEGFYNFVGGSQSVSDAIAAVITEKGGTIRTSTLATKIVVEGGRAVEVQTADDVCYRPRYVVSNANAPATVEMIGRDNLPEDYVADIDEMTVAIPVVALYLGVDHDYVPLFDGTHEILLQDSLDTDYVFQNMGGCDPAADGLLLIANYSAVDPTAAPEGKNVISITSSLDEGCDDDWGWGDPEAYLAKKKAVADAYLTRAEAVLPGLREHVEVLEIGAPQTLRGFTLNPRGTIYGWRHTPDQALMQRLPPETPVENLFLAGMWTFPGAGQSAVLGSGEAAARLILATE
jgi:all-trans-retinol 13,14-reductase